MSVVDPRERHDDLLVADRRERVAADRYGAIEGSESAVTGWLVLAYVFDDAGRLLLVEQPGSDAPFVPSAVPALSESLADAVTRAVREETGVDVTPIRAHAVEECTIVNDATGETAEWTTVHHDATVQSGSDGADPAGNAPEAVDVSWFEALPDGMRDAGPAAGVYDRCLRAR